MTSALYASWTDSSGQARWSAAAAGYDQYPNGNLVTSKLGLSLRPHETGAGFALLTNSDADSVSGASGLATGLVPAWQAIKTVNLRMLISCMVDIAK